MAETERFYVEVDRADGSRTYKGPLPAARAAREADAWNGAESSVGEHWVARLRPMVEARGEVQVWRRATKDGGRYFPRCVHNATLGDCASCLLAERQGH